MTHVIKVKREREACLLAVADGDLDYWRSIGVDPSTVPQQGARDFTPGHRGGRSPWKNPTLADHLRGYGWSRMSVWTKALVVILTFMVAFTINERLDNDRTFNPPTAPVIEAVQP